MDLDSLKIREISHFFLCVGKNELNLQYVERDICYLAYSHCKLDLEPWPFLFFFCLRLPHDCCVSLKSFTVFCSDILS